MKIIFSNEPAGRVRLKEIDRGATFISTRGSICVRMALGLRNTAFRRVVSLDDGDEDELSGDRLVLPVEVEAHVKS